MDFSSVLADINVSTVVAAMIAAAMVYAGLSFASFAARSVAFFFDRNAALGGRHARDDAALESWENGRNGRNHGRDG